MRHRILPIALGITSALLVFGARQASAQGGPSDANVQRARTEIDSVSHLYTKAFADADVRALIALYDTNASELLPKGQNVHGHPALLAYWGDFIKKYGVVQVDLHVTEFWVNDDRAYETGNYTAAFTPESKIGTTKGNFTIIWKRQTGGGWKISAIYDTPK